MNERETIDRGWYYVIEPDDGRLAPRGRAIRADDGRHLTRRLHGCPGRIDVVDRSDASLAPATLLRAAGAVGAWISAAGAVDASWRVELGPAGTPPQVLDGRRLVLDGPALAALGSHHPAEALVAGLLTGHAVAGGPVTVEGALPSGPVPRALFFESLMNTDMPHNDREISQGVLHMISGLRELGTEVVLVNAKMPIVGDDRPVLGLNNLQQALSGGRIGLVSITLLEGYWEGVVRLIKTLRELGCRAHIAVGGVMPSLAPEHVAAHLPEVSFVCRGAGECFVTQLCRILGDASVDEPLTEAQVQALLALPGMIVVDRARPGLRLLSCVSAHTARVGDLDRVSLDLSFVERRHIEGGIEVSTSRGCIHKCSFCSILGRESYQARSAGSIIEVLQAYEDRFRELHGARIPANAYRVHFSDDDFACDRERARELFLRLPATPFRLSSVQVAIGDLCLKVDGKLQAEPDHELLDAMRPDCFADHGRPIPKIDYFEDHRSRSWSSFLQIGVETYSDAEIARLGKGYKRIHVRTIVAELARRGLHMDGYFILSNAETSAEDLVEVFSEVARLKLRFPEHFHMRFPVVPHLVSYFTAASHRRHVRQGRAHVMKLRGFASVPGHPEYDYPFVDHDVPMDGLVDRTVETGFVTDERFYLGNLSVLTELWRRWEGQLPEGDAERLRMGRLIRALDDRPRRLVFEMLRQAWLGDDDGWPDARLDREASLSHAEHVLGPHGGWFPVFRQAVKTARVARLVAVAGAPLGPALDLLLSSDQPMLELDVVGPGQVDEAAFGLIGRARAGLGAGPEARSLGLRVDAACLRAELLPQAVAAGASILVRAAPGSPPSALARAAREAGLEVIVSVVVGPDQAATAGEALRSAALGASVVQVVPGAARPWTSAEASGLARALFSAAAALRGCQVSPVDPVTQGLDIAVDGGGRIGRSDGLDAAGSLRPAARLASLEDLTNIDRHRLDLGDPDLLRELPAGEVITRNRHAADQVIHSFVAWLKSGSRASEDRVDGPQGPA